MDRPIFLNSSGGIIAPYASRTLVPILNIAPYVEDVTFPVVSVDLSAIYGDHPENLATVTISSGAALTFFVDSIAGGNDSSGNGSYDRPWRSLKTASNFLHCAQCTLNTAAKYIQVKVRGTVDYGSAWDPLPWRSCKLILAGWDERCDLGSAYYAADYAFNLKGRSPGSNCSNCVISGGAGVGSAWCAVDCEVSGAVIASAAYNCSGGRLMRTKQINAVYGGNYSGYVDATYVYRTHIARLNDGGSAALYVSSAAVSANVTATMISSGGGLLNCSAVAVSAGYRAYLADCEVSAVARAVGGSSCYTIAAAMEVGGPPVVSGGVWYANAIASAVAVGGNDARAVAYASGLWSGTTAHNAQVAISATASARCEDTSNYRARAYEIEYLHNLDTVSCWTSRIYHYRSDVVTSTTVSSSGNCP